MDQSWCFSEYLESIHGTDKVFITREIDLGTQDYTVWSVSFKVEWVDDDGVLIAELKNICLQEEVVNGSIHNVLNSTGTVVMNVATNTIFADSYLDDKYNDGADGWFGDRIVEMFDFNPPVISAERARLSPDVFSYPGG